LPAAPPGTAAATSQCTYHKPGNVHGGAIALGHPLGASGTRIAGTLIGALEERNLTLGLQTMCAAGGMANATIFERI
jgi:acetyl-CoA acyltransferase